MAKGMNWAAAKKKSIILKNGLEDKNANFGFTFAYRRHRKWPRRVVRLSASRGNNYSAA